MKNKFGIVTRASDPTKLAKAVKEGIFILQLIFMFRKDVSILQKFYKK